MLEVYPDNGTAYHKAGWLYHERLFQFSEAFALNRKWLERYPEDLAARFDSAEKHFTTGRFEECEKQIAALLAHPEVGPRLKIVLRVIEIPNLLALDKAQVVTSGLDTLIEAITSQTEDFTIGWFFEGTKHFISQTKKFELYREWLLELFKAVESENRDAILAALREVRANFHSVASGSR